MLILAFGILFVLLGLEEKLSGRDGAIRRGRVFVYWYQTLAAGAVAVCGSTYVLLKRSKKEPNQSPQRNAGSRPSSDDSPASETPPSLGPRG